MSVDVEVRGEELVREADEEGVSGIMAAVAEGKRCLVDTRKFVKEKRLRNDVETVGKIIKIDGGAWCCDCSLGLKWRRLINSFEIGWVS